MPDRNEQPSAARKLAELLALAFEDGAPAEPPPGAPREGTPPPAPPPQQLGEYQLLEKIGEGGMGTVYRARHVALDRLVAIKIFRPGRVDLAQAAARFRREIRLAGRLDDPHLVRAFDARTIGETQFLVMEYVDGCDLQTLAARRGPLPLAEACELIRQAADGLQSAHEQGLVHRDIKPSNLMLSRSGQVKILDLGLARLAGVATGSQAVTVVGQVMGTPDYIAPEQVTDSHGADIRADIYSLGCTFYHLLAGRPPFGGTGYRTVPEKMTAHMQEPVPPIRGLRADVPDGVVAVLARMLAKHPADRYPAPRDVAGALAPLAAGADLRRLWGDAAASHGETEHAAPAAATIPPQPPHTPARSWHAAPPGAQGRLGIPRGLALLAAAVLLLLAAGFAVRVWRRADRGAAAGPAAATATPTGSPATATPSPPPPAPLSGWIVLSWTRPGLGKPNLWLFAPDGQRRVNITRDPQAFHIHPHFSPDGRRLAFIRGTDPLGRNALWVCDADGGQSRELVAAQGTSERLATPVWVSDSRLYYVRDPVLDRAPDMEVWQVDVATGQAQRVFLFREAFGEGSGMLTDAAPDGQTLLAIVQTEAVAPSADVFVCDLTGKSVCPIWQDATDDCKDAAALWSPDARRIAWQHHFTPGLNQDHLRSGVGFAWRGADETWTTHMQPPGDAYVVPLAWNPQGDDLLCVRLHEPAQRSTRATLFCLDDQFQTTRPLFALEPGFWPSGHRDLGRLADWALVPADLAARLDAAADRPD